jgi:hypothetical protein
MVPPKTVATAGTLQDFCFSRTISPHSPDSGLNFGAAFAIQI